MKFIDRTGEIGLTNEGYEVKITEYIGANNMTITFIKSGESIKGVMYKTFIRGNIKNPYHTSVCKIGYLGIGKHRRTINKKNTKVYSVWQSIIHRCYDLKYQKNCPTYVGCTVVVEWHNFQNFAEWFEDNYIEGFHLDKDILIKGNKVYSPETCCFVPREINNLLIKSNSARGEYPIGVSTDGNVIVAQHRGKIIGRFKTVELAFKAYKVVKENWIKEIADKWKPFISERVYETLYKYKVNIND